MIRLHSDLQQWLQEYLHHPSPLEFDDLCEMVLESGYTFGTGRFSPDAIYAFERIQKKDRALPTDQQVFFPGSPAANWAAQQHKHMQSNSTGTQQEYLSAFRQHLHTEWFSSRPCLELFAKGADLEINQGLLIPSLSFDGDGSVEWPALSAQRLDDNALRELLTQAGFYCCVLATKKTEQEFTRSLKRLVDRSVAGPVSAPEPF